MNQEHKIFEAIKNKNMKAFGEMLTDDAVNIDPQSLLWDKASIVKYLTNLVMDQYSLNDMKVSWFDKDCAAVTYRFSGTGSMNGEALPPGDLYATTIWVKRGNKWLARYHQETPIMPMDK